jgi:hypothetical protein
MAEFTVSPSKLDAPRDRLDAFARRHAQPIVLGCMLGAALLVQTMPGVGATRCMLAGQQGLGTQAAASLSIVLTALVWAVHKPALRLAASLRRTAGSTPTD